MADEEPRYRIGEVAELVSTTPRTIRYYEEIGLLEPCERAAGKHRHYTQRDVERLRDLLRLKELLNVSLEELKVLADAEAARAALRAQWNEISDVERRAEIAREAMAHIDRQLELVRRRRGELTRLEAELSARRERLREVALAQAQPSR
jgi:MerR family transcriptional regulator, repressor of the yfmOP operon